jgi:hypothetical protein
MTTQEIKSVKIGSQLTFMCYGMRVFGRVTGIYEARTGLGYEVLGLQISHDQVQWGEDVITKSVSIGSNLTTIEFI